MHRLIHILLFMLVALPGVSQDNMSCPVTEKSSMPRNIKVSYDYHYFTVRGYEVDRPMILKAGQNKTQFYNPMTVWFSDEIPLQEGPWKLGGLPGLILEAKDCSGQYHFIATGIEFINEEVPPIYEKELYEKINRLELLRHKRFFDENFGFIITAQTDAKHLKPSQFKSLELKTNLDYLETDY